MAIAAATGLAIAALAGGGQPQAVTERCATRSGADFLGAYANPDNLVIGPLALVGLGGLTPARVVEGFGGNKLPVLVENGHSATVAVHGRGVTLGFGPLPEGDVETHDGHRAVRFVACRGRKGNSAGDRRMTFWMGFLMADEPRCVRVRVWIDRSRSARSATVPFGRECGG